MPRVLIAVASWEERFPAGVERSLSDGDFSSFYCLASARYEPETRANRHRALEFARERGLDAKEVIFSFEDQVESFSTIRRLGEDAAVTGASEVVFDISTSPRSIIWTLLLSMRNVRDEIGLKYYRAAEYATWMTEEEGDPKLIVNGSGIMYPDLPTCLVMLCGPEISRAEKMFYRFEPRKTMILRDVDAHKFGEIKHFGEVGGGTIEESTFDNKDFSDENLDRLAGLIRPYEGSCNIVTSAFGPKLGAILLYRLAQRDPEIALSYVTSGRYNLDSTRGIGDVQDYRIRLREVGVAG